MVLGVMPKATEAEGRLAFDQSRGLEVSLKVLVADTMAGEGVCKCFDLGLEACTCFGFDLEAACNCFGFAEEACKCFGLAMEAAGRYFGFAVKACKNFGLAGMYSDLEAVVHNYYFGLEACRYSDFEGACNCWYFDFAAAAEDRKCHLHLAEAYREAWGFLH